MSWKEKAIDKLNDEYKGLKNLGNYGNAVAKPVKEALITFCGQEEEFAQAVVQSDKSLHDCIKHTIRNVKSSISDLEVYKRAVEYYFHGSTVHMTLTVDLTGSNSVEIFPKSIPGVSAKTINLSFDDLFD